eukprot:2975867-Alexandrium_andersonii.AAC.1
MSASLVGSEMCIRDRASAAASWGVSPCAKGWKGAPMGKRTGAIGQDMLCLLYTSDAADDM